MAKVNIAKPTLAKLIKFAKGGGSRSLISSVIGDDDENTVAAYLKALEKAEPELHAKWTGLKKKKSAAPVEDDDEEEETPPPAKKKKAAPAEDDLLGDMDDDDEDDSSPPEKAKAGGSGEMRKPAKAPDVDASQSSDTADSGGGKPPTPRIFRLRDAEGFLHKLEIFSEHPEKGYTLEIPQAKEIFKTRLKGQDYEFDLVRLRADPTGKTYGFKNTTILDLADNQ